MDDEAFSAWIDLEDPTALAGLPSAAGLIQVRVAQGLVRYPSGRSAMIWYGAGPDLRAGVLAAAPRIVASAREAGIEGPLWVRTRKVADPAEPLARLIQRFAARFGTPPRLLAGSP
jgi:hypothetical protein